jgi:hypothetical protein
MSLFVALLLLFLLFGGLGFAVHFLWFLCIVVLVVWLVSLLLGRNTRV